MQVGSLIRIKNTNVIAVVIAKAPDCFYADRDRWTVVGLTNNKRYEMGVDNPHLEVLCK